MKISVNKKRMGQAPEIWLRQAGYVYLPDRSGGQPSFARRLSRDFYPRFHVYFTETKKDDGQEMVTINLHLDQKKPGYAGYNRHNAEYDGEIVAQEAERLQKLLLPDFFI